MGAAQGKMEMETAGRGYKGGVSTREVAKPEGKHSMSDAPPHDKSGQVIQDTEQAITRGQLWRHIDVLETLLRGCLVSANGGVMRDRSGGQPSGCHMQPGVQFKSSPRWKVQKRTTSLLPLWRQSNREMVSSENVPCTKKATVNTQR